MIPMKPIVFVPRRGLPKDVTVLSAVVSPKASKDVVMARSYTQLVTVQGVHPDRAKALLGLAK